MGVVPSRDARGFALARSRLPLYERARRWLFGKPEDDMVLIAMRRVDAQAAGMVVNHLHRLTAPESDERYAVDRLAAALEEAAYRGGSIHSIARWDPETREIEWQPDASEVRRSLGR